MFLSFTELFITCSDIYFVCISITLHAKSIAHAVLLPDSHLVSPFPQFWSYRFKKKTTEQEAQKQMMRNSFLLNSYGTASY